MSGSQVFRGWLERAGRGRSFRRRLPVEYGRRKIWVSPDARLRFLKIGSQAFDSELLSYVGNYVSNGDVVWDIGSNVGEFALAAADKVGPKGQVVAVEADLELAFLLNRTIFEADNRDLKMKLICAAVADKSGLAEFRIAERGRAANSLAQVPWSSQAGGVRNMKQVPLITLDTLLESYGPPNFLKIDVEGAELLALQGASKLLATARPKMILEVSSNSDQVQSILKTVNYRIFDAADGLNGGEIDVCAFNTLAIPNEKMDELNRTFIKC